MTAKLQSAIALVGGAAIVLNGFFGSDLRNDVEMPMTDEEHADRTPPTKTARIFYILSGGALLIYGVTHLSR